MGNCQAVDAAALVIQHPTGKIERMYWSISASEVMKMNPGHYVSLIIPLPPVAGNDDNPDGKTVRFTRVKLLRPSDTLVLGRAYRLVPSHEVMKVLRAKRHAQSKKEPPESMAETSSSSGAVETTTGIEESTGQEPREKRMFRQRSGSASIFANSRSKSWRPSLQSISEAASK